MRAGAEVTVVERDRCGGATSLGNAGWVVPSISIPMPAPGITVQALKMLFKPDGPLRFRPRLDPDFLRWCWRFWRNSSWESHEAGLKALMTLNQQTIQLYKDIRASGVEFEMHETGLLIATLSEETLEEYAELLEGARAAGYTGEVELLGKETLLRVEPAVSDAVVGAVYAKDDLHVRPDTLVSGLASYLAARGVQILEDTEVSALEPAGKGRWLVSTSSEKLAADLVIGASGEVGGAYTPRIREGLQRYGRREGHEAPPRPEVCRAERGVQPVRRSRANLGHLRARRQGSPRKPAPARGGAPFGVGLLARLGHRGAALRVGRYAADYARRLTLHRRRSRLRAPIRRHGPRDARRDARTGHRSGPGAAGARGSRSPGARTVQARPVRRQACQEIGATGTSKNLKPPLMRACEPRRAPLRRAN